ncbi:MAG: regulatory protein RecX [Leptotrichiaceae bacterium]|nr:regulatory protein RecX [Leptotrichiaceae bacterium]
MTIEKIQKNKLYLSSGEIMDISPLIRQKYGLKVNDNIESLYDDISYEASLEKGIFLLSLKDRTEKELKMKLNEKYTNHKMVEKAVLKLSELGYINDLNYAVSYINSRKYGVQRIVYNLLQKGIKKEKIEEAYEIIRQESGKDIEDEKLEKAVLKNIKKEEHKLIQYLARQGFELDKIFRKVKKYKGNIEFENYDE